MSFYRLNITVIFLIILSNSCFAQYTEPKPIMGQKALKTFLKYHMDYPQDELKNNTQGIVVIKFTTDKNGKVIDYYLINSISPKLDSSALSLFKLILWSPATSLGKTVIGSSNFELKFNIKSFQKLSRKRGYKHITLPFTPVDTSMTIYNLKQVDIIPKAVLEPGPASVSEYIYSKLTYPEAALRLGIEGEVKVSFIIETNGFPSNIVTEKHLGAGCTEETIKIIETLSWVPGIKNNEAVRTYYNISVHFKKDGKRGGHIPNQQGSGI